MRYDRTLSKKLDVSMATTPTCDMSEVCFFVMKKTWNFGSV
jgi:hypothetical protein